MSTKTSITLLLMILMETIASVAMPVQAHVPACTGGPKMSVQYPLVDAGGYAPVLVCGSEELFNDISSRDSNFAAHREPSSWQAANYWLRLMSSFYGVSLIPLPPPTIAFK